MPLNIICFRSFSLNFSKVSWPVQTPLASYLIISALVNSTSELPVLQAEAVWSERQYFAKRLKSLPNSLCKSYQKVMFNLEKINSFPFNKITTTTEVFQLEKSIKIESYRNVVSQSCMHGLWATVFLFVYTWVWTCTPRIWSGNWRKGTLKMFR